MHRRNCSEHVKRQQAAAIIEAWQTMQGVVGVAADAHTKTI